MHIKSQVGQWKKKEKNLKCPETNKKKLNHTKLWHITNQCLEGSL